MKYDCKSPKNGSARSRVFRASSSVRTLAPMIRKRDSPLWSVPPMSRAYSIDVADTASAAAKQEVAQLPNVVARHIADIIHNRMNPIRISPSRNRPEVRTACAAA
jgi:hypothetical protein